MREVSIIRYAFIGAAGQTYGHATLQVEINGVRAYAFVDSPDGRIDLVSYLARALTFEEAVFVQWIDGE